MKNILNNNLSLGETDINDLGYRNNVTIKLIQFLTKNLIKVIPLWTKDFVNFYTIEEANSLLKNPNDSGRLEYKDTIYSSKLLNPKSKTSGGGWYLSPYINLQLQPLEGSLDVNDVMSLFYKLMPVNISIREVTANFFDASGKILVNNIDSYRAVYSSYSTYN